MVTKKLTEKLIFLSLVIFPFGQLSKLIFGFHVFDVVIFILALVFLSKLNFEFLKFKYFYSFLIITSFSLLVSLNFSLVSTLYLIRLMAYFFFTILLIQFLQKNKTLKPVLLDSLLVITCFIAIFGYIQYLWIPDLRTLKLFGWDDHYYRLTSTFLDPAFTGIILVFGILLAAFLKKYRMILILLPALALTYSRASFLALLLGLAPLFISNSFFLFLGTGEGVNLLRTNSIFAKLVNYKESLKIISDHPLFGVGYNNICSYQKPSVNACFGLDNSFLFLLATTGFLGLVSFIALMSDIFRNTENKYKSLIVSSGIALFVHTQFTNTMFYAWVMFWFGVLIAIGYKDRVKT